MNKLKYDFSTPMMQQYLQIKAEHQDCLLLFRLGDFYELFLEDAKIGSQILNIVLTSRDRGKDGRIPMAGVPYHAADSYISKLIKAGYKVAICDQVSEPNGKGLVERKVTRIITPGTTLSQASLNHKTNNFIISLSLADHQLGIATTDLSTGVFYTSQINGPHWPEELSQHLTKLDAKECIVAPSDYRNPDILSALQSFSQITIHTFSDWIDSDKAAQKILKKQFSSPHLKELNLEQNHLAVIAAANLIEYLKYTQKRDISHIRYITPLTDHNYLTLDRSAIVNLELLDTIYDHQKKGSLLHLLDQTTTAMGARLLKDWLIKPLQDVDQINHRLDNVEFFSKNHIQRDELRELMSQVADLERLISRINLNLHNPKDLILLKNSLEKILEIKNKYQLLPTKLSQLFETSQIEKIQLLIQLIESQIIDDPPFDPRQGKLIRQGVDPKLDKLKNVIQNSRQFIAQLEMDEKKKTNISSLKVKFNKVFGFYIEISNSYLDKVPDHYQRKQTLVNAERFITDDLKEHEQIILSNKEETDQIEYQIYLKLSHHIIKHTQIIQKVSYQIAQLDCWTNLAQIAQKNHYCRPLMTNNGEIKITQGRHPVIEHFLTNSQFVPNDTLLDTKNNQLAIITGPNMAGKSVYLRQVALITLMAHMGSFVPAQQAEISLTDRIFVRSGASDMITSGLSTFMVEMVETATILHQATEHSLIIMDEIGRGTSTYDGISIAWSVAKYLVTQPNIQAKTLFATHYHELQKLEEQFPNKIKNYQVAVSDHQNQPIFLHQVIPGGASHSFGIAVAKLAGLPADVIQDAEQMLPILEQEFSTDDDDQIKQIKIKLNQIDLEKLTPIEALNLLNEIKEGSKE